VVAKTLDIDPSRVTVHKCHLGGGFGRRGLAQDWARQAVLIARQLDQPVKMIWTRRKTSSTTTIGRPLLDVTLRGVDEKAG